MTKKEIIEELADIFEMEVDEISDDIILQDLETWDSVAVLSIIAVVGEKLNKYPHATEISESKKMSDIYKFFE